jgi:(p)ppGpp synthase/HD superfamily hydrolase
LLSDRFGTALGFAEMLHRNQRRKGTSIPYIAHLLAVAATALEWGVDEDTAIAAVLHDAVEDQGGLETAAAIGERFGARVEALVLACSDSVTADADEKLPWKERKLAYVAKLATAGPDVALITASDKLHNLRALVRDVRRDGPRTLDRFDAGAKGFAWYFPAVADAIEQSAPQDLVAELRREAAILNELALG